MHVARAEVSAAHRQRQADRAASGPLVSLTAAITATPHRTRTRRRRPERALGPLIATAHAPGMHGGSTMHCGGALCDTSVSATSHMQCHRQRVAAPSGGTRPVDRAAQHRPSASGPAPPARRT
jgi:hypothetical protein